MSSSRGTLLAGCRGKTGDAQDLPSHESRSVAERVHDELRVNPEYPVARAAQRSIPARIGSAAFGVTPAVDLNYEPHRRRAKIYD